MKKMLKIMAMLLVIATVIFAAGCAEKKTATEAGNVSSEEQTSVGESTPNENVTEENVTEENVTEENVTEENVTENETNASEVAAAPGEDTTGGAAVDEEAAPLAEEGADDAAGASNLPVTEEK